MEKSDNSGPNPKQEFIYSAFAGIIGEGSQKKLVVAKGVVNGSEKDLLCLRDQNGKLSPVAISPYLVEEGLSNTNIPFEDIEWTQVVEPIKLREAAERKLLTGDVALGLQAVTAASLRLDGKSESEVAKELIGLTNKLEEFT